MSKIPPPKKRNLTKKEAQKVSDALSNPVEQRPLDENAEGHLPLDPEILPAEEEIFGDFSQKHGRGSTNQPVRLKPPVVLTDTSELTDEIQTDTDLIDDSSDLDDQILKFGSDGALGEEELEPSEMALPPVLAEAPPSTTLDAYLREIRRYPILSKEEEHALALKVFHENDREAAYKLITSNLRLAVKIARDYERAAKNLMDLIQEGNIGLIDAVKNFDPYREVRFPSYAIWWIKAYIIRYVMANWRMVKIGTTQAQRRLFFNLKKEREKLEREGFTPRADILAKRLNVKEQEVIEMEQRLNGADMSVDAPLPADPETNLLALLPAEQKTAEEILEDKEFTNLFINSLKDFEATLNAKELAILKNRLLKDYEEQATLKELASQLAITHERVRQIEVRVKDKLKKYLLDHMGSAL